MIRIVKQKTLDRMKREIRFLKQKVNTLETMDRVARNSRKSLLEANEEQAETIRQLRDELLAEKTRHDRALDFCSAAADSGFIPITQEELDAPIRREDIPDDEYAE